jgi:competence protein ComEA
LLVAERRLASVAGISAITLEVLEGRLVVSPPAGAPRPPPAPTTFDPNRATEAELAAVVGIGAVRAKAIVSDRNANGRYATCRDLARVPGLGPATVSALSDRCRIR